VVLERTDRLLPASARGLLSDERGILSRLRELLASQAAAEDDLGLLRQAELDLDELFLLVIVGEFNAGKSASSMPCSASACCPRA
jgi:hypothetical protein